MSVWNWLAVGLLFAVLALVVCGQYRIQKRRHETRRGSRES